MRLLRFHKEVGIGPDSSLIRLENTDSGIEPVQLSDNWLISTGIPPLKSLSLKSNKVSLVRLPMAVGIKPESLQLLRLKAVMLRNGVKLKLSNVPLSSKLERCICEISPLEPSHTTLVQLHRLMMLLLSHESREDGFTTKVFFHLIRASACVLGEHEIFNGIRKMRRRREKQVLGALFMYNIEESAKYE
ncbi:hypothetical protein F8388_009494 [Cannabis sativa]|uniref:Uncharacterized protein n=1 Tax=Cannabis sativa TaxID=3483 RepID=A0A7J6EIK4_CANSA|nr:hypothetical protein F8388_009494 [Cannabis sativa]